MLEITSAGTLPTSIDISELSTGQSECWSNGFTPERPNSFGALWFCPQ